MEILTILLQYINIIFQAIIQAIFSSYQFIAALLIALAAVKYDHLLREQQLKKAFIQELIINKDRLNNISKYLAQGGRKIKPILSTQVFNDILRSGLLYGLPKEVFRQVVDLYEEYIKLNTTATSITFGLSIIPEEAISEWTQYIKELAKRTEQITSILTNTWKIKYKRQQHEPYVVARARSALSIVRRVCSRTLRAISRSFCFSVT